MSPRVGQIPADELSVVAVELLTSLPAAVVITDLDGRVAHWLGRAEEIFGYPAAEVVGQPVGMLHRPEARDWVPALVLESIETAGVFEREIPCVRKDGQEIVVDVTIRKLVGTAGKPWLVAVSRDVSEGMRLAEREEHGRTLRLQAVTAAFSEALTPKQVALVVVRQGIAALSAHAGSITVLDETTGMLELLEAAGYPQDVCDRFRRVPLDAEFPPAYAVREGEPLFLSTPEERRAMFPGLAKLVEANGNGAMAALPLVADGKVLGSLGFNFPGPRPFDAAERAFALTLARLGAQALRRAQLFEAAERARAEAVAAREQAREADRRKDEFLAILGHELRNPLAPIVTALELMRLRSPGTAERERGIIERQVRHLGRLVDDLLDISRITRSSVELRREPVDIADVVGRAIETTSPLLEERRHQLVLDAPHGCIVDGDPTRLAQCVANLVTNAAKYTPAGGTVSVTVAREHDTVRIAVRDDGSGLPPELVPRLFDPFVQGSQRLDRAGGGLGLGLTIVKSLIELHAGTIRAESPGADRGSTFTIRLPLLTRSRLEASDRQPRNAAVPPHARRAILIVDDNQDAGELLREFLEAQGHDVRLAIDGPSALAGLATFLPDIALLDIGLPGMDGYELATKLREHPALAHTRLMALTGYGQREDVARARQAGFDRHFVKPIELDQLALELVS